MDIFFNAYKSTISPDSPVIVYKNGAFGFNPYNATAVHNFFKNMAAYERFMKQQHKNKKRKEQGLFS